MQACIYIKLSLPTMNYCSNYLVIIEESSEGSVHNLGGHRGVGTNVRQQQGRPK